MADELEGFGGFDAAGGKDGADKGGKMSPAERIAGALREHCGIELGDVSEVADLDMLARLVEVAAANYKAGSAPEPEDEDLTPEELEGSDQPAGDLEQPPEGTGTAQMPPLQMSQAAHKKQLAQAETFARRNLKSRIARLDATGRATPDQVRGLDQLHKTLKLSFAANGDLEPNKLTDQLDMLEQNPAGAARGVRLSQRSNKAPKNTRAVAPSPYEGEAPPQTPAEVDAAVANFFKTSRGG